MQDGEIRKVSYLDTENAHYSIFRRNNKIDQITKSYDTPKPMKFNGKIYNITFPAKSENGTVYEQINPKTYSVTQIQVDNKGKVVSINEPFENKIANGVKKIFGKIGRGIKKL